MIESTSPPTKKRRASDCCGDSKCTGLRNHYFDGKRLTPDTFRVEQAYGRDRRHLLNRTIHGWGVVNGYAIKAGAELSIGPGLALDQCGRELLETMETPVSIADVIVFDDKGAQAADPHKVFADAAGKKDTCWVLKAHYAEYDVDSVSSQDPCQCTQSHWDRVCETVRYSLGPISCDQCCAAPGCELQCACDTGGCCEDDGGTVSPSNRRGSCRCICDHLTHLQFPEGGRLCSIEGPCNRTFRVALREGVALACVKVVLDCGKWTFAMEVEACGPRRLVKRNDLLFDLIRGCDLTRISDIGWRAWHRNKTPILFEDFSRALGEDGSRRSHYVTKDFWVKFSGPVRPETLLPDCVAITILSHETKDGWIDTLRVPIVRLDTTNFREPDSAYVNGFNVVVSGAWLEDAVRGRETIFHNQVTWVEIEIRGDLIADCNGQPVDANSSGLTATPTGNGTPGGTFLSTFAVNKPEEIVDPQ